MEFIKHILYPATFSVDSADGSRRPLHASGEAINRWVNNTKAMIAAGLKIPAPWRHDDSAVPAADVALSDDDSRRNAGYWKDFWVEPTNGHLYGKLFVPDTTPSGKPNPELDKIGTSVTEVSPYIKQTEWTDGLNRTWKDFFAHVALVTHPVVPNQENFVPAQAGAFALSLSNVLYRSEADMALAAPPTSTRANADTNSLGTLPSNPKPDTAGLDKAGGASITDVLDALREFGLDLPNDTTQDNFAERVIVAIRALKAAKPDGEGAADSTRQPPKGSSEQPSPIAMNNNPANGSGANNQAPNNGGAAFSFQSRHPEFVGGEVPSDAFLSFATGERRQQYIDRVEELIKSGRITPKYADDHLLAHIQDYKLSFNPETKQPASQTIDSLLTALEAMPAMASLNGRNVSTTATGKVRFNGADMTGARLSFQEEQLPENYIRDNSSGEVSDADADRIVAQQLGLPDPVAT